MHLPENKIQNLVIFGLKKINFNGNCSKKHYDIWYLHTQKLLKIYVYKFAIEIFTHKFEFKLNLFFFQKIFLILINIRKLYNVCTYD